MNQPFPVACATPPELRSLGRDLPNFATAMRASGPVSIVAIGSSSTEGDGASNKEASYPSRLSAELAARFPDRTFDIYNAGVRGQEAPDEAARFKNDVLAKRPSLVIWQVGTNAAWKDYFLDDVQAAIFRGLGYLGGSRADVILMDLQYAPALLDDERPKPATAQMLELIASAASRSNVGLFRRFAIMKHWYFDAHVPFEQMISNFDGHWLHQNDWSYDCIARALCDAIIESAALE
ncbi:SGNH/GDSL hydrolase family protein [Bradyrhizobium canariense]|nr:SGNH/GDSL hydrolase family protein [Bradyrhizobium canariense]